jgi:polyisoprenoid-binding protein YceI
MTMPVTKIRRSFAIISFLAVWLPACAAPAPTATPVPPAPADTAAPTAYPAAGAGNATAYPGPTPLGGSQAASSTSGGASVTYELVAANSEASYAIREQLARLSFPSDAIGKTQAVSGTITVNADGTIDSSKSKFTVDVSTLKSDERMRDGYVSRNILQTSQYPQVVFVPTAAEGLPSSLPTSGNVSFKVMGNLTIKDVTKPVTWDVTGSVSNGEATGTATTTFTFEDFNLPQPQVPVVLSVVDKITLNMKVDLKLKP